jgi:hypothetical protein
MPSPFIVCTLDHGILEGLALDIIGYYSVNYDRNMLIIQATGGKLIALAYLLTKKVYKADQLTHLSTNTA